MMKRLPVASFALIAGAAILTLSAAATQARAATSQYGVDSGAIPLSNLVGTGSSILVGDKIFDNFTYITSGTDMPVAADVNITPEILTPNATPMYGFHISGAFQDLPTLGNSVATLTYDVHVVDPTKFLITAAQINGDPDVINTGSVDVTEKWIPQFGSTKIGVYDFQPGGPTLLQDLITFDYPVSSLNVSKVITASVGDGSTGSAASVTSIDQLYAQTAVPEPASLALLALGGLGLLARRRK